MKGKADDQFDSFLRAESDINLDSQGKCTKEFPTQVEPTLARLDNILGFTNRYAASLLEKSKVSKHGEGNDKILGHNSEWSARKCRGNLIKIPEVDSYKKFTRQEQVPAGIAVV